MNSIELSRFHAIFRTQNRFHFIFCLIFLPLILVSNCEARQKSSCQEDGFFPHPSNCAKFYRCHAGRKFDFDCGPGTHYNPSLLVCDWPSSAGCEANRQPESPESTQPDNPPVKSAVSTESSVEYEYPSESPSTEGYYPPDQYTQKYRQQPGHSVQYQSPVRAHNGAGGGGYAQQPRAQLPNQRYGRLQEQSTTQTEYDVPSKQPNQHYGNQVSSQFQQPRPQSNINRYEYPQQVSGSNYNNVAGGGTSNQRYQQYGNQASGQFQQPRPQTESNQYGQPELRPQYGNKASGQFQQPQQSQPEINPYEYPQQASLETNYNNSPVRSNPQYGNRVSGQSEPWPQPNLNQYNQPESNAGGSTPEWIPSEPTQYGRYQPVPSNRDNANYGTKGQSPIQNPYSSPSESVPVKTYSLKWPTPKSNEKFQRIQQQPPNNNPNDTRIQDSNQNQPSIPTENRTRNGPKNLMDESYVVYEQDNKQNETIGRRGGKTNQNNKPMESHVIYEQDKNEDNRNDSKKEERRTSNNDTRSKLESLPTCSFVKDLEDIKEWDSSSSSGKSHSKDLKSESSNENSRLCTSSNFDWLEIADSQIVGSKPRKEIQFLNDLDNRREEDSGSQDEEEKKVYRKLSKSRVAQKCHELCLMMSPIAGTEEDGQFVDVGQQSVVGDDGPERYIACIAYSYSDSVCQLYDQLELEPDWIEILLQPSTDDEKRLPKSLQPKQGQWSRINVPKSQLILRTWLVSPSVPEQLYRQPTVANSRQQQQPIDNYSRIRLPRNSNRFLNCFNACLELDNCQQFSYDSASGDCFLRNDSPSSDNNNNKLKPRKNRQSNENQFYRSGIVSGYNLDDLIDPSVSDQSENDLEHQPEYEWHFYSEQNPIILQLMERLLLMYRDDYAADSNRYLRPFETIHNVSDPKQCQKQCYDTWTTSVTTNSREQREEERIQGEDTSQKKHNQNKRCKFVAIQEDLIANREIDQQNLTQGQEKLDQHDKKAYSCLLFSEDAVEVELKLLQNEDEHRLVKELSLPSASAKVPQMSQQRKRRSITPESGSPAAAWVKGYVFDDWPAIRFYQIEDRETIETVQRNQKSFMEWRDVLDEQVCFQDCLQTLNSLSGVSGHNNKLDSGSSQKCRFLVIRPQLQSTADDDSHRDNSLTSAKVRYNCSFYDHDPRQSSGTTSVSNADQTVPNSNPSLSPSSSDNPSRPEKFIIHSYPLRVPASHSIARDYFRTIQNESNDQSLVGLHSHTFHQIDLVQDVNYCLHYCLKMWIQPNSTRFPESKCHKVQTVTVVQDDLVRYNCTFNEFVQPVTATGTTNPATTTTTPLDNFEKGSENPLLAAFEASELEEIGFQLEHLRPLSAAPGTNTSSANGWSQSQQLPLSIDQHFRVISLDSDSPAKPMLPMKPSILLDQQPDYRQCLQLCLDFWARIRLGDQRRDRCRLVVVRRSTGYIDQYRKLVSTVLQFECRFYDVEIEKKQRSNREHKWAKIFRRTQNTEQDVVDGTRPEVDQFVPDSIEAVIAWDEIYHYSRASSTRECVQLCRSPQPELYQFKDHRCNLVIAEPIIGYDPQLGRRQIEYQCSFYGQYSNLTEQEQQYNRLVRKLIPEFTTLEQRLRSKTDWAYQLMRLDQFLNRDAGDLKQEGTDSALYFDEIDYESEPVRYANDLFEPIFIASVNRSIETPSVDANEVDYSSFGDRVRDRNNNHSDNRPQSKEEAAELENRLDREAIGQCLDECLRFNQESSKQKLALGPGRNSKNLHCQMVTVSPGRVKLNQTLNFNCKFYNFNATEFRFTDLDNPEPIQAYKLSWKENPLTTLEYMIRSEHDQLFTLVNSSQSIHNRSEHSVVPILSEIVGKRRAFLHLTKVTDLNQCFTQCVNSWMMRFLYRGQPQLCRLLTVRSYVEIISSAGSTASKGVKYDCSFYEVNITSSLQSMQIMVREPTKLANSNSTNSNRGEIEEESQYRKQAQDAQLIPTEDGSLYKQIRWPLAAPYETDITKVLDRPAGIQHCTKECDQRSSGECRAILLQSQRNQLVRCYFIGSAEYLPNRSTSAAGAGTPQSPVPMPSHNSQQLLVKLSNVDYDFRSHRPLPGEMVDAALGSLDAMPVREPNPYLTMIDAIRNYELNQPLVDRLAAKFNL